MIGKPSSPVRREAARKRTSPTAGTSPRGRPILLAAELPAAGVALRPQRRHDLGAAVPGRRPDLPPPTAQQRHQREPRTADADAAADRRVDAASGRQASSASAALTSVRSNAAGSN